jgi:hypothetical protein
MDIPEIVLTILKFLKFNQLEQCRKVNKLLQLLSDELIIQLPELHQPHKRWLRSHLMGRKLSTMNEKWVGNQITKTFFIESFGLYVVVYSYRSPFSLPYTYQIWFRTFRNCRFMMKYDTDIVCKSVKFMVKDNYLLVVDKSRKETLCCINMTSLTFVEHPCVNFIFGGQRNSQVECLKNSIISNICVPSKPFLIDNHEIKVKIDLQMNVISAAKQYGLRLNVWGYNSIIWDLSKNGVCFLAKFKTCYDWDQKYKDLCVLIILRNNLVDSWKVELYNLTQIYHKAIPIYNDKTAVVLWSVQTQTGFKLFPFAKFNPPQI